MGDAATVKITGTLQKSTEIMKLSNSLIKLPELSATMRSMSEEMMKVRSRDVASSDGGADPASQAGIMDEMLDDTMESLDDNEDELEEEAQEEVDKVLFQITDGKLGVANGKVGAIPVSRSCCGSHRGELTCSGADQDGANAGGAREGRGDGTSHRRAAEHLSLRVGCMSNGCTRRRIPSLCKGQRVPTRKEELRERS